MKIAYIGHTRFPTERAHGFQMASVCGALTQIGHQVVLTYPRIGNRIHQDPFTYYGLPPSFAIQELPSFDALSSTWVPGSLAFLAGVHSYKNQLRLYLRDHPADLLYVRSHYLLPPLLESGIPVIIELHALPRFGKSRFVRSLKRCKTVVCLTTPMRDELLQWGADASNIIVEGDGVDLKRFEHLPTLDAAKKEWKLDPHTAVIGYVGSLTTQNMEKGIPELLEAVKILKHHKHGFMLWVVGGPDSSVQRYKACALELGISDVVRFEGAIGTDRIPRAMAALDVTVYPAPKSDHPYFVRDTSPLKLLEYMAANRAIVCADIPPVHDLVDEQMVRFCEAGDGRSMADAIAAVFKDGEKARAMARKAHEQAKGYSWKERMKRIIKAATHHRVS